MSGRIVAGVRRFLRDEGGPTAVEYAVMLMLIITVCITAIQLVGRWAAGSFGDSSKKISDAFQG